MSGPQPGTPTPWAWYKMAYGEARGLCGPDGQFVIDPVCEVGDYGLSVTNSLEVNEQDAAAIVHRMNNWDAVEADNAALKAKNEALVEAANHYAQNYLLDEYHSPDLCMDDAHRKAVADLFEALAGAQ